MKAIFLNKSGRLRLGWLWLIGFAVYFAWVWGTDFLFAHLFGHLTGLIHEGILQTPMWETFSERGWGALASIAESAGLILIFSWLYQKLGIHTHVEKFNHRICTRWMLVGVLSALAGIGLCLLTDSLRFERPFTAPDFSWTTLIAIPEIYLATRAGEVFMMDYLYDGARQRLPKFVALGLLIVVEFVADAAWHLSWIGMLNLVLQVALVSFLHERYGLAAAAGLWFGWDYMLSAVFPIEGMGVWPLYRISDVWLTGSHHGLFEGVWMSAMLLGIMLFLFLRAWAARKRCATA